MSDEVRVSQRYRELATEEPPQALDAAILAAAKRSTQPWTRRWAVPLSLAAVVVLSVTVTLRMQYEQPAIESPAESAAPPAKQVAPTVPKEDARAPLKLKVEQEIKSSAPPAREQQRARAKPAEEPKPFTQAMQDQGAPAAPAAAPAPPPAAPELASAARRDMARGAESSVTGSVARQAEERTARDAEAASRAPQVGPVQALAKRAEAPAAKPAALAESPERELERIAQLRREGRHEEADKALAEFRKRHPDYRIPEKTLERVERR